MDEQSGDGFDHPDDVPVTDADDIPEINSADEAVDGDEERKQRLIQKAKEMKEENDRTEQEEADDDEGTPVDLGDSNPGEAMKQAHEDEDTDFDAGETRESLEQAGSIFSDTEEEDLEDTVPELELKPVEDVPDDFDYEQQDTADFGGYDDITIEHNDTYFKLTQPSGTAEDKFWSEMQQNRTLAGMFDCMIRYSVDRPRDIEERMERENWSSFAKAGLATKCSAFLGVEDLQDF